MAQDTKEHKDKATLSHRTANPRVPQDPDMLHNGDEKLDNSENTGQDVRDLHPGGGGFICVQ
ncbi:hypothetical protein AbraIFM66950_000155 [Aspergillus brasiliensis]|nr:hypothetical protein AbraIFM66950_000155 [Aspergillus brasiliensis]